MSLFEKRPSTDEAEVVDQPAAAVATAAHPVVASDQIEAAAPQGASTETRDTVDGDRTRKPTAAETEVPAPVTSVTDHHDITGDGRVDELATDDLAADEPVTAEPVSSQSMAAEPVTGASVTGGSGPGEPRTAEPVAGEAVIDQPIAGHPVAAALDGQAFDASAPGARTAGTEQPADWRQVLLEFVDHPRDAVEKADRLVDDAVRSLTERIHREHSGLREAWHTHGEPSTEDLRNALRGYRDFFEKVLSNR